MDKEQWMLEVKAFLESLVLGDNKDVPQRAKRLLREYTQIEKRILREKMADEAIEGLGALFG